MIKHSIHIIPQFFKKHISCLMATGIMLVLWAVHTPASAHEGNERHAAHIDTLQYAGDEAINLAIASEGYTEDEMEEFRQEGEKLVKGLFSISPFDRFKGYFNLFLIRIPSAQSGISTPNHETDTPFKVRASGNGLDRLLVPDDIEACKRIADSLLGEKCDILCLAANFPDYGGAGGEITVVSGHYMATEILAHELGHSVGGLGDEYYSCEEFIGRFPNMSLNAHDAPWIGIPGSGIYPLSRPDTLFGYWRLVRCPVKCVPDGALLSWKR